MIELKRFQKIRARDAETRVVRKNPRGGPVGVEDVNDPRRDAPVGRLSL
jgi:hypothetical protein